MKTILVPGWLGAAGDFDALSSQLPADVETQVHELPGLGGRGATCYESMIGYADDLLTHTPRGSLLFAYSLGARVGLLAASRAPQHFRRLVLCGVHPGLTSEQDRARRRALDAERARDLVADPNRFLDRWFSMPLFRDLQSSEGFPGLAAHRRSWLRDPEHARSAAKTLESCSLGRQPDLRDAFGALPPVHLVNGARDAKFRTLADELVGLWPDRIEAHVVEDCGHALLTEAPERLAAILLAVRATLSA